MSCTDKVTKWTIVGLTGALLGHFIEPIYFSSITIGDYWDEVDLKRALFDRLSLLCGDIY